MNEAYLKKNPDLRKKCQLAAAAQYRIFCENERMKKTKTSKSDKAM